MLCLLACALCRYHTAALCDCCYRPDPKNTLSTVHAEQFSNRSPPYIYVYVCCIFWNTDGFTQVLMNLSAEGPGPAFAHELAPVVARVGCNKCGRFMTFSPSWPLQAAPAMPLASAWLQCYCHCAASATGGWRCLGPVAELISCPAPMSEDPGSPSFLLVT